MAFDYAAAISTDRDRVRFHIRDIEEGHGPLPGDENFTNAEIDDLLTQEGNWGRAVAACLEILAIAWRRHPKFQADSFTVSRSHIPRGYADDAKKWRKKWGYNPSVTGSTVSTAVVKRLDAYSNDLDATETSTL
jgi:hypothetical protein